MSERDTGNFSKRQVQPQFYLGRMVLNVAPLAVISKQWEQLAISRGCRFRSMMPLAVRQLDLRTIGQADKASAQSLLSKVAPERRCSRFERWTAEPFVQTIGSRTKRERSGWDRRMFALPLRVDKNGEPVPAELAAEREFLQTMSGSAKAAPGVEGKLIFAKVSVPYGQPIEITTGDLALAIQQPILVRRGELTLIQESTSA